MAWGRVWDFQKRGLSSWELQYNSLSMASIRGEDLLDESWYFGDVKTTMGQP